MERQLTDEGLCREVLLAQLDVTAPAPDTAGPHQNQAYTRTALITRRVDLWHRAFPWLCVPNLFIHTHSCFAGLSWHS